MTILADFFYIYRYYFFIMATVVIFMFAILYLFPVFNRIKTLGNNIHSCLVQIDRLNERISHQRTANNVFYHDRGISNHDIDKIININDDKNDLIKLFSNSELSINLLSFKEEKKKNYIVVKANLTGTYVNVLNFFYAASHSHYAVFLKHLAIGSRVPRHQDILIDLIISKNYSRSIWKNNLSKNTINSVNHPENFCSFYDKKIFLEKNEILYSDASRNFSVFSIQLVGLIALGNHRAALLLAPHHRFILVKQSDIFGKERGIITIFSHYIDIRISTHRHVVLHLMDNQSS